MYNTSTRAGAVRSSEKIDCRKQLIGPRTLAEMRTSFAAPVVELTDEDVRWLNLEMS